MENAILLRRLPPKADESFPGYIVRLTEENGYETPSWILGMAGIRNVSTWYFFLVSGAADLRPLSKLTGVTAEELRKLVYPPATQGDNAQTHLAFGSLIPRHLIRVDRAKVCPSCLAETDYARRIWEFVPVTACPLHGRLLLETCPKCRKRISWARGKLSFCSCGADWRDAAVQTAGAAELRLARLIHERCGHSTNEDREQEDRARNPLYGLDIHHLLVAVLFIAAQERFKKGSSGASGLNSLANESVHVALSNAFEVFDTWPDNFHRFLDRIRGRHGGTSTVGGLHRTFGRFYPGLYRRLSSRRFDFMRAAFEDYLTNRWDSGLIHSKYKDLLPNAFRNNKYVGKCEAARELKVSSESIDGFVDKGLLRGTVKSRGKRKVFRIERLSLDALSAKKGDLLIAKQAAGMLCVDRKAVADLVAHGCLTPLANPSSDGSAKYVFERNAVEGLLSQIAERIPRAGRPSRKGMIDYRHAARSLTFVECGTGRFIREIIDGHIQPAGERPGIGLLRFLFGKEEISKYLRDRLRKRREGLLSTREAARALGMKDNEIHALARKGILRAAVPVGNRTSGGLFDKMAIEDFISQYVSATALARDCGITSRFLMQMLAEKGVAPVTGRREDPCLRYLYRRADMEPLNMREMVAAARQAARPKRKRRTRLLSTEQAAEILGIGESTFRRLVQCGDLHPRSPRGRKLGKGLPWRFSRFDVKRYKARRMDERDLVSSHEAAALLGENLSWFYKRWVRTGRLSRVAFEDKLGKHFFRRSEVEKMVELKKSTVTGPEAAKVLGMHRTAVLKLTKKGMLKPVSGPDEDGFGCNLYLLTDVEKLREERTPRALCA